MISSCARPYCPPDGPCSVATRLPRSSQSIPCEFLCPADQTVELAKGLSAGTPPSRSILRILPASEPRSCARAGTPASPVVTYRYPSGPNCIRPPSWYRAPGMPSTSMASSVTVPSANR